MEEYGTVEMDSELLDKDFDDVDLYGEIMEENNYESDILFE